MRVILLYDVRDIRPSIQEVLTAATVAGACPDRLNDLKLCLYELLGNALLHSQGAVSLTCLFEAGGVRVSVRQTAPWQGEALEGCHKCLEAEITRESGRGLFLVRALSDDLEYLEESRDMRLRMRLV